MELWELWPILPMLGLGTLSGVILRAKDTLIQLEYTNYHEEWLKDGEPYSGGDWRWRPPEAIDFMFHIAPMKNAWASSFIGLIWLIDTPEWAKTDSQALKLLKRMRLFTLLTFIAFIGTVIILGLYG